MSSPIRTTLFDKDNLLNVVAEQSPNKRVNSSLFFRLDKNSSLVNKTNLVNLSKINSLCEFDYVLNVSCPLSLVHMNIHQIQQKHLYIFLGHTDYNHGLFHRTSCIWSILFCGIMIHHQARNIKMKLDWYQSLTFH